MKRKLLTMILSMSLIVTTMFSFPLTTYAAGDHTPYGSDIKYTVNEIDYYDVFGAGARDTTKTEAFIRQILTGTSNAVTLPKLGNLEGSTLNNWRAISRYLFHSQVDTLSTRTDSATRWDGGYSKGMLQLLDKINKITPLTVFETTPGSIKNSANSSTLSFQKVNTGGLRSAKDMATADLNMRNDVASAGGPTSEVSWFKDHANTNVSTVKTSGPVFYDTSIVKYNHTSEGTLGTNPDVTLGVGLVFYDFNLHYLNTSKFNSALGDKELADITPTKAGATYKAPGIEYSPGGTSTKNYTSGVENLSSLPIDTSQEVSSSTEATVENSWETSEEYGFEEMIGSETNFEAGAIFAKATQNIKLEFKASQVFSKSKSQSTSNTESSSVSNSVSVNLPPYTALMLEQNQSDSSLLLNYDYPVAVSYKVKVVGLMSDCRGTDVHTNKTIATFGNDLIPGHKSALDNMSERVLNALIQPGYEETNGDNLPVNTVANIKNSNPPAGPGVYYNSLMNSRPMSVAGGALTMNAKSINSKVYEVTPVYPISKVSLEKIETLKMTNGDEFYVDNIPLNAFNDEGGAYYGFDSDNGEWKLINEDGSDYTGDLASLKPDPVSGYQTLTAGKGNGTVYLKYVIDEKCYTSSQQIKAHGINSDDSFSTNSDLKKTAVLKVNVVEDVSNKDIQVKAEGSLTGYVDDDPVNLYEALDAYVLEDDMITALPVTWEAQDTRPTAGVKIDANNISFTKKGSYKIRARYGEKTSGWITVEALPASENPKNKPIVNPETEIKTPVETNIAKTTVEKINNKTYTGKAIKPKPVVTLNGKTLAYRTDYTLDYQNNIEIGTATITIKGIGKYEGTKVINFKIVPEKPSISNKAGSGKIKVKWKKVPKNHKITKYQVRYKVKGAKKWIVKDVSAKKNSVTLKKLKKGKTYKIQVRSYKKVGKTTYHSAWSKTMSKKCK